MLAACDAEAVRIAATATRDASSAAFRNIGLASFGPI
jgi:hypothetical protein